MLVYTMRVIRPNLSTDPITPIRKSRWGRQFRAQSGTILAHSTRGVGMGAMAIRADFSRRSAATARACVPRKFKKIKIWIINNCHLTSCATLLSTSVKTSIVTLKMKFRFRLDL